MKKFIVALVIILFTLFIFGYGQERQEGYDEGYAIGLEEGHANGLEEAKTNNQQVSNEAYEKGKKAGYDLGYREGYEKANQERDASAYNNNSPIVNSNKSTEETTPTVTQSEETVYITKTGSKYHRSGCQYLRESSIKTDLNSAKNQGYTPCSRCY